VSHLDEDRDGCPAQRSGRHSWTRHPLCQLGTLAPALSGLTISTLLQSRISMDNALRGARGVPDDHNGAHRVAGVGIGGYSLTANPGSMRDLVEGVPAP
jgi:hypothetical protein